MDKSCETQCETMYLDELCTINLERKQAKSLIDTWAASMYVCVETMLLCGNHFTDFSFPLPSQTSIFSEQHIQNTKLIIYVNAKQSPIQYHK